MHQMLLTEKMQKKRKIPQETGPILIEINRLSSHVIKPGNLEYKTWLFQASICKIEEFSLFQSLQKIETFLLAIVQ